MSKLYLGFIVCVVSKTLYLSLHKTHFSAEFIVEIRYFTVSLALFNPAMMTDVVLTQSNKFTVFLVLCRTIIQIASKISLFHCFAVLSYYLVYVSLVFS